MCGVFCKVCDCVEVCVGKDDVPSGPYNVRPYLPPLPGKFFAIAVRRDLNLALNDLTVRFSMREGKHQPQELHAPVLITKKMFKDSMSASIGEGDAVCVTWAVNDNTDTLTWIMLVMRDDILLKLSKNHLEKVESFAKMDDEQFEVREKRKKKRGALWVICVSSFQRQVTPRVPLMSDQQLHNLLAVHARKLQIHCNKKLL